MTTAGRNQLLGLSLFIVSLGALAGLLFFRQNWFEGRDAERARLLTIKGELKTAEEERDKVVKNAATSATQRQAARDVFKGKQKDLEDRVAAIENQLPPEDAKEKKKEKPKGFAERLERIETRLMKSSPPWGWLGWPAGLLPVICFLLAINFATEHGKRFVTTMAVALTAAGLFYFRDPIMGIDLKGGAELRYKMDTSAIDREIEELEGWLDALRAGGSPADGIKRDLNGRIGGLEKKLETARGDVSKGVVEDEIKKLRSVLNPKDNFKALADMVEVERRRRESSVNMAVNVIRRRIDAAGIRQVNVRPVDGGSGLLAQLPTRDIPHDPSRGDDYRRRMQRAQLRADLDEVRQLIETPGRLGLHHVDACGRYQHDAERWKQAKEKWNQQKYDADGKPQKVLPGFVMVRYSYEDRRKRKDESELLLLREKPVVTGEDLSRALVGRGDEGVEVQVWLKGPGGEKMEWFTNPGNKEYKIKHGTDRLAVVLDGDCKTAPTVQTGLGSFFRITGGFTVSEAERISRVLNAGSLTYSPKLLSESQVGPGLGRDSIRAGTRASLIGAALVVLFMGIYYLGAGLIADFALMLNIAIILGAMNALGGTFTLPGIAGIALTIGMAVDANVLIFERVREEKLRGKPLKLAVKAGHDRALVTILDSNVTTLITAFILYGFGTGAVKGFAVTLSLGIIASLFTALYVTRALLEFVVDREWAKELKMCRVVGDTKVPFMKLRPAMFVFSGLLVAGSIALFATTREKWGLDFTGGLEIQAKFAERQTAEEVRGKCEKARETMQAAANQTATALGKPGVEIPAFSVQSFNPYIDGTSREFKISCQLSDDMLELVEGRAGSKPAAGGGRAESAAPAAPAVTGGGKAARRDVKDFFREAFTEEAMDKDDPFPMQSRIGKRVAGELLQKAVMALALSVIFIFIYIVVRFDFVVGFGLGAAAALVHDAAISLGALLVANQLGMAGARIDLVIIAALLTIIGYSLNDTIVVFDRIRENRAAQRSLGLRELVDISVNQTLGRTVLTSVTTLMAVVSILVLGGSTLRPFALVFTVGVVVVTYSSVFVASAVAVSWENWREKRREAAKKKLRSQPQGAR